MNNSPWQVENMARMQRERIQEEMNQIRLEEKALGAQARGPGLVVRLWLGIRRWLAKPEWRSSPGSMCSAWAGPT